MFLFKESNWIRLDWVYHLIENTSYFQIDDLPAGDYEIVAMFSDEDETEDEEQNSYRRPRLANYRNQQDCKSFDSIWNW